MWLKDILTSVRRFAAQMFEVVSLPADQSPPKEAATETTLYNFDSCYQWGCLDGVYPESGLTYHDRTFYGTTTKGGAFGHGTVFELSPNGSGGWNETVLYSFSCDDRLQPFPSPTFDSVGNLYSNFWRPDWVRRGVRTEPGRLRLGGNCPYTTFARRSAALMARDRSAD